MSLDQLYELNDMICQRIDELRARNDMEVLRQLWLGQQVHSDSQQESTGKPCWFCQKTTGSGSFLQVWSASFGMWIKRTSHTQRRQ